MRSGVGDGEGIVVVSRGNARVKQMRAAFAGTARLSDGMVGIEGEHLIEEAVRSGVRLLTVFLGAGRRLPAFVPSEVEVVRVSGEVFASAVETRSPQGIAALMRPPVWTMEAVLTVDRPLLLVAVGVQDPGNLGTLIRSAEAFGAHGVMVTEGTVSAWNGKVVRSSVGSVFRVPVVAFGTGEMRRLKERGVRVLAGVGRDGREIGEADLRGGTALMVGSEGAGLPREWMEMADERVTVPCPGPVESLNAGVAGSVMLYEASRQRMGTRR